MEGFDVGLALGKAVFGNIGSLLGVKLGDSDNATLG
jgi:hypothetical protein